jgi:hypothetical protein
VRHTWLRSFAALAAMVVVVAACSSDRGDDPTATGGGDDAGGSDTTAAGTGDTVMFGDLESPCGEAEDGAGAASATDQGVTDSQIVIGYGDDAGFPTSPGLSHETSDAIAAMIDWCNEQGGINGRQLVGNYYDAAITDVVNAMTEACGQVFMLVGEAWALDSGQEETRLGCGLPAVPTYSVSPEFANAPLMYQAVPNPADIYPAGWAGQIAELFPDDITNASVMFGNFAATIDTKDKVLQTFDDFGFHFLDCPIEYNIAGEPDWKPFAQRLKDCGAQSSTTRASPTPTCRTCSMTPRRSTTTPSGSPTRMPTSSRSPIGTPPATAIACTSARRSRRSSRLTPTQPPSSTWTSSPGTVATSASWASSQRRRSSCGRRRPRSVVPS